MASDPLGSGRNASEVRGLARSGSLNLVGSLTSAGLALLFMVVLNRGLGLSRGGAVLSATAMFQIAATACALGVDTGLVRTISGRRARGGQRLGDTLTVALVPVGLAGGIVAVGAMVFAPTIGKMFGEGQLASDLAGFVRVAAPFIVASSLVLALLGATRGYGTMKPTVALERSLRPGLQVALVGAAAAFFNTLPSVAVAWAVPYLVVLVVAFFWLRRIDRRDAHAGEDPGDLRRVARDFWAFTLPRSFATTFRVALQWLDVVLVGALASPGAALIYGVATRLLQFGVLAAFSVSQAIEPRLGAALAENRNEDAVDLYRVATTWLVLLTWPVYLVVTLFAPAILAIFGPEFVDGSNVVAVLVVSVMFGAAAGPVDILLLMAGKSSWSLANTGASLGVNIALNMILVPQIGIIGAALAWTLSRILGNVLPLIQTSRLLAMRPFGRRWLLAMAASGVVFGGLGLLGRTVFGSGSITAAAGVAMAGGVLYLLVLRRFQSIFHLDLLASALPWRGAHANR